MIENQDTVLLMEEKLIIDQLNSEILICLLVYKTFVILNLKELQCSRDQ